MRRWLLRNEGMRRTTLRMREKDADLDAARPRRSPQPPVLHAFVDLGLLLPILGAALMFAMLSDHAVQRAFARVGLFPVIPHLLQLTGLAGDLGGLLHDRLI